MALTLFGIGGAAVVNADNCCNLGWQCQTEKDWDDGYYAYRRNQCPASATSAQPSAPQPAAAGQVSDNCCGIDRQCYSEHDWIVGWHAFRLGQCQTPATSVRTSVQQSAPTGQVNGNCCGIDRECHTHYDFRIGKHAFLAGHCQTRAAIAQSVAQQSAAGPRSSIDNCCHLDRSCHSEDEWRAGYAAFEALECWEEYVQWKRTPDPRYMPASGSDNCCTAPGWQCQEDEHFRKGFWAFQEYKHCAPNVKATYLPKNLDSYVNTENCCHYGWICPTDQNWVDGYHAYRANQCPQPAPPPAGVAGPIQIHGPGDYVADTLRGLQWLLTHAPQWYTYVTDVVRDITVVYDRVGAAVYVARGHVVTQHWRWPVSDDPNIIPLVYFGDELATFIALLLVHEACHVHAARKGGHDPCHDGRLPLGVDEAYHAIDVKGYWAWHLHVNL